MAEGEPPGEKEAVAEAKAEMAESKKAVELPVITGNVLLAAAAEIGRDCSAENVALARCKTEDTHVDHCLKEGSRVHKCVHQTILSILTKCPDEFIAYKDCLEKEPVVSHKFIYCREKRDAMVACLRPPPVDAPAEPEAVATASVREAVVTAADPASPASHPE